MIIRVRLLAFRSSRSFHFRFKSSWRISAGGERHPKSSFQQNLVHPHDNSPEDVNGCLLCTFLTLMCTKLCSTTGSAPSSSPCRAPSCSNVGMDYLHRKMQRLFGCDRFVLAFFRIPFWRRRCAFCYTMMSHCLRHRLSFQGHICCDCNFHEVYIISQNIRELPFLATLKSTSATILVHFSTKISKGYCMHFFVLQNLEKKVQIGD